MGEYRELEPPPALRDHLHRVWYQTVDAGEPARAQRVLPDACIDVVWPAGGAPFVAGPDTRPQLVPLAPGQVLVGARFRPGRAPDFLGVAAHELRDAHTELAALWGEAPARRLLESDAAGSIERMLRELQAEIAARAGGVRDGDAQRAALAWAESRASLDRLGADLSLGDRQVRRRVEERFGYGPAVLRRVLRLQRLLGLAPRHRGSLADLALAAGYADQAHMTRECQRLAGLSPVKLLAEWGRNVDTPPPQEAARGLNVDIWPSGSG
jgi:AraC-like DNA-binding protein